MQLALRQGYVVTFRELACAPGCYSLDPEIKHPEFVRNAIPSKYKKEELQKLFGFMKVEYELLPLESLG